MPKIAKAPRRGSRYGPFLSVGELLDIKPEGLKDSVKLQFLPQWEAYDEKNPEAVLSKRFVMVDLGRTEMARSDLDGMEAVARNLATALHEKPAEILKFVNAFGPSGTREDREAIPRRAAEFGLASGTSGEPVAIWIGLLVAAAVLLSGCVCQETDTDCGNNGSDTDDGK